jgi:two-component system cell cycle sensor histidine kinase/response regulator CckA
MSDVPTPIRLLMVEDSPCDSELIQHHLKRAQLGFSATVVDKECAFRSALASSEPDVILADYHLPGFNGLAALRIARSLTPATPFIFVSGSFGEEQAIEALREGATDYILKDRMTRLAPAIVRALAESHERALRQRAENDLRLSEQRFQYAAAATREIIWDWNLLTGRIWFNEALHDLWGYDRTQTEVESTWLEERIHPDDREPVKSSFRAALPEAGRWAAEFRLARADDSYRHVLVRGMIVRDGEGLAVRVIGAMFDVTERLQLEQAQRVESLGRVAATIAHEFNNVLMGIQPMTELLRRGTDGNERVAAQIASSVSRGRRLTEQILRFATPAEPEFCTVDFPDWFEQFVPELQALLDPGIALGVSFADRPMPVRIDPAQIQQVISNIILNARDAMPAGGIIEVTAEPAGEMLALTIADDGSGIPPGVRARIFEPLFTTKRSGTGLGLAVAQQIIAQHGGSIRVSSTPGAGTTFTILLPALRAIGL